MTRRNDPVDIVLDIVKIGIIAVMGYIIIKALLSTA